jgi:MobA/MobL family.
MAVYHAHIATVSRSAGHTATAAAAYRAGLALTDERTGERHDYTRRGGVVDSMMFAPALAPEWAKDPAALWNGAEAAENRKNSTVAREFEISLPHELNPEQRRELVADLAQSLVDRYGFAVQASTHEPHGGKGDDRNHHVHILATTRRMTPDGLGEKTRELDGGPRGREEIQAARALLSERINHHLVLAGLTARVDHRSLADQSAAAEIRGDLAQAATLAREPTQHEGKTATAAKRAGRVLDRVQHNDQVRQDNRDALAGYLRQARAEGRILPTPPGQREQAAAEVAKQRQAPSGPLVQVGVQGYTRMKEGKPVQVAGHTRTQHAAAAQARPMPRGGSALPVRGGSHAPTHTGGAVGAAPAKGPSVGKSKEQRAEEQRAAAEAATNAKARAWLDKQLNRYLLDLDKFGRQCSQVMEDALRGMMTAQTPEAREFRLWLSDRGLARDLRDEARTERQQRLDAHGQAQAKHQRRQKRLDRFTAENPEPGRLQWKSKRAWAERREKLETGLARADSQQRQSRVLVSAAEIERLDARAAAKEAEIRRLDEQRVQRWPLPGEQPEQPAAKPVPLATVAPVPGQVPRTLGQAVIPTAAQREEEERRRRDRAGMGGTLRPRPRPPQ